MRTKKWIGLGLGILAMIVVVAAIIGGYLFHKAHLVPAFYEAAMQATPAEHREASEQMLQKTTELVSAARKPGEWQMVFTQEEINGWLAVDLVENHAASLPSTIKNPRVVLKQDQVIVACQVESEQFAGVLSIVADVYVSDPNTVAIRLRQVKAGELSLPKSIVLDEVSNEVRNVDLPIQWRQQEGDPVLLLELDLRTKKGESIELEAVQVVDGRVNLAGSTKRE